MSKKFTTKVCFLPPQLDIRHCLVLFVATEEGVEVVAVEQLIVGRYQVQKLVESVRPLCYRLRL